MNTTVFRHLNDRFKFGKFIGCTLGDVMLFCPSYIAWVVTNVQGGICVFEESAIDEIQQMFPDCEIICSLLKKQRLSQLKNYFETTHQQRTHRYSHYYENETYELYNGSYAQDEMGYSDDDIDTIFDGDPLAYWNID